MYAVVSLRTQYTNLGDLLINVILVSSLTERCTVICDVAGVPDAYLAEFSGELRARGVTAEFVADRMAMGVQVFRLLSGGASVIFMLSPGDNVPTRNPQRAVIGAMARTVRRLFVAQVGASYPALSRLDRFLLRGAAKRPHLLAVRDAASQARLQRAGVTAAIVPDLAFLQALSHKGGERFMMTFRERNGVPFESLVSRLLPLLAMAREGGLVPGFCWQVAGDEAYARKLAAACGAEVFQQGSGRPTLEAMSELYRRSAVICSNRLHALLLGAANGALPLACLSPEDHKVSSAFAAASLESMVAHDPAGDGRVLQQFLQSPEQSHRMLEDAFASASAALDGYFKAMTDLG